MIATPNILNYDSTNEIFYVSKEKALVYKVTFTIDKNSTYSPDHLMSNYDFPLPKIGKHNTNNSMPNKAKEALNALRSYQEFNANPQIEKDIVEAIKWLENSF